MSDILTPSLPPVQYPADSRDTNPELVVELQEYQALRQEIISRQEFARQSVSASYVALGVLAAGAGFIIDRNLQALFLLFPFLLYGLAWSVVRYTLSGQAIGRYLAEHTVPRIREILKLEDSRRDYSLVMSWQTLPHSLLRDRGWWALPVAGAHYGVIVLGAVLSFAAYFVFPPNPPLLDWVLYVLVAANVGALIYSIAVGFRTELGPSIPT